MEVPPVIIHFLGFHEINQPASFIWLSRMAPWVHPHACAGEISFDEFVSFLFPAERRIRGPSRSSSLELLP